jgi:hypothetical protein
VKINTQKQEHLARKISGFLFVGFLISISLIAITTPSTSAFGTTTTCRFFCTSTSTSSTCFFFCSTSTTSASSSSISSSTTTTSVSDTSSSGGPPNPYWNSRSQEVANWVVTNLWNPQVDMLSTSNVRTCTDSNGGVSVPCPDAFWTTSDNLPTCASLIDFGYASTSQSCINKIMGCDSSFVPQEWMTSTCPDDPFVFSNWPYILPKQNTGAWFSGWRYEGYFAIPIPVGSPSVGSYIVQTGYLQQNGQEYAIKSNSANGNIGTSNINGPVDIVAPQAINYYLRGNLPEAQAYAQNLVSRWDGRGVSPTSGSYSTWQLGQVMFVMRVLHLDTSYSLVSTRAGSMSYSSIFNSMENKLWSLQASDGHLPNQYNANGPQGGQDSENQDAGLLPFSYSLISLVQGSFGVFQMSSPPN